MKRFASNYLWTPDRGFVRQYIVEIGKEGRVAGTYPLNEEVHSVEWLLGLLVVFNDNLFLISPFDFDLMQPVASSEILHIQ